MLEFDNVDVCLPKIWESHARTYANKDAVICGEHRLTWSQFDSELNRLANALIRSGINRGDKVVVLGSNSIESVIVIFGIIKAGACAVPLSTMLSTEQLVTMITDSDARLVFVSEPLRQLIDPVRTTVHSLVPNGWISMDFSGEGWLAYDVFIRDASNRGPQVRYSSTDIFMIIYSSGTTGLPKGIVHSHYSRHQLAHLCAIEMRFDCRARALTTTAVYSMGTFLLMLPVMFVGGTLVIMRKFTSIAFLELMQVERITHSFMVPSQYLMVLTEQEPSKWDFSSIRCLLSAGSPLRKEIKERILREMTPNLFELYGNSEGFATMLKPEQQTAHGHTVGAPFIGYEAKIVDINSAVLPVGEPGEIVGYGGSLMKRYHNRPTETSEVIWRDEQGRGFVRTGDIGSLDQDGFVTILDRKKDMIISGGFNVFPADIERVVSGHEAVLDVAVIGVPHPRWDETPFALIVRRPGSIVSCGEIIEWVNSRVARHQRLSGAEFRDEFPRNALGKVLKRILRDPYWSAANGGGSRVRRHHRGS
jgi:long-chain acyl-CoA synthetase